MKLTLKAAQCLHAKLCAELGVAPATIQLRSRSRQCPVCVGAYFAKRNCCVLYVEALEGTHWDWRTVLAHETYHHFQYKSGQLTGEYWRGGTRQNDHAHTPYNQRPWERAAIRYERKIAKREGWT
jgi:hypothetical protein